MGFTGEARFGDWIETMLYNGIGAALPTGAGRQAPTTTATTGSPAG